MTEPTRQLPGVKGQWILCSECPPTEADSDIDGYVQAVAGIQHWGLICKFPSKVYPHEYWAPNPLNDPRPFAAPATPTPPQPAAGAPIAYKTLFTACTIVADSWCNTEMGGVIFKALHDTLNLVSLSPGDYIKIAHERGCEPHSGCTALQSYRAISVLDLHNGLIEISVEPLPDREVG